MFFDSKFTVRQLKFRLDSFTNVNVFLMRGLLYLSGRRSIYMCPIHDNLICEEGVSLVQAVL